MNSLIRSLLLFQILVSAVWASSDVRVETKFSRDTCEFGEEVHLYINLKWKGILDDINDVYLDFPVIPWLKVDNTGTSLGLLSSDSAFYRFDISLRFFSSKESSIEPVKLRYQYNNKPLEQIELAVPSVFVINSEISNPVEFLRRNAFSLLIFTLFLVLLIVFVFRYRGIKSDIISADAANRFENYQKFLLELEQLFIRRKMNYHSSVVKLNDILLRFKANLKEEVVQDNVLIPEQKINKLLKKNEVLCNRSFTSFRDFESIYHETFQLISNYITENSHGGRNDNGHSED